VRHPVGKETRDPVDRRALIPVRSETVVPDRKETAIRGGKVISEDDESPAGHRRETSGVPPMRFALPPGWRA